MPWRVACFDLDGTLVPGTSTCQHLADRFGHGDTIRDLERRYATGEISNDAVALEDATFYAGKATQDVAEALESIPLVAGIPETVAHLRRQGIRLLLTTVTWEFAAAILARRFGFDGWTGCAMGASRTGALSGTVERHFDAGDKLEFVRRYCDRAGIALADVFAVGDSRSDIPLFGGVGFSVALNATPAARAAASVAIDTADLRDVLAVVPGLRSDPSDS